MNQQIQKRQASALDRAKVALAHGAHAIDSSDVSELIQELEKQLEERKADDVRLEWMAANPIIAKDIFWNIHRGQEKFLRGEIYYRMQQHAAQGGGRMMLTDDDKMFCDSIGQHVRQSLLAWWAEGCGTTSEYESRAGEVLTPEAQADRDDFDLNYAGRGCRCHISPPCNYCVHPGNPENQEEDDDCWMLAIKGGAR